MPELSAESQQTAVNWLPNWTELADRLRLCCSVLPIARLLQHVLNGSCPTTFDPRLPSHKVMPFACVLVALFENGGILVGTVDRQQVPRRQHATRPFAAKCQTAQVVVAQLQRMRNPPDETLPQPLVVPVV